MNEPIRVLYVDDYPLDRELVRDALEKEHGGFQVTEAASRQEFEAQLAEGDYDIVLSDFNILGFEGLEVIDAVRAKAPRLPVVIVTGTGTEEVAVEAMRRGAADYVVKTPHHIRRLPYTILAAMEKERLRDDRERIEEELRTRGSAIASSLSGIAITDGEGKISYVNPSFLKMWRYDDDKEILGRSAVEFWQMEERASEVLQTVQEKGVWFGELVAHRKDGSPLDIQVSASAITDATGSPKGLVASFVDITERKRAEEALRENTERLLKAQRIAKMGFLDWNLKTNEMLWSDQVYDLYGVDMQTEKSNIDLTMQLVHPDDLEFAEKNLELAIRGEKEYDIDHRKLRPDGKVIWVHAQAELVRDADGTPESLLGTVVDITERKRVEEALREAEERYRAIFEQAADSIVLADTETGSLVEFNDRTHENLGYTREEFQKLKMPDFEVTESAEEVAKHIEKIAREGADDFETKHRTKDGEIRDILVSSRAISIGGRDFAQGIWRDITERKRAEEALREQMRQVERLNELFIGREHRVIELKREVNSLLEELGQAPKYESPAQVDELRKEARGKIGRLEGDK